MKVLHELKKRGNSDDKAPRVLHTVKWPMTSEISTSPVDALERLDVSI